ncbi:MAG TPA: carboxypeptidase regulatory-like domain-containing protein [Gemmatimonadales bacterium]
MGRLDPRHLILGAGLSLGFAAPAAAQSAGVLRGVVFDSLITSAPLEGAEIWIESTNLMARSDAAGHFALTALAPGRYVLTVYHPILDSAGLSVPPVVVDVVAGDSNTVALATPSPAQAHHLLCPRDPLRSTGGLVGVVHNAADGRPMAAATISAHWTTYDIGVGATGVRSAQRAVEAKSDVSGHVLLCGLPTDVALVLRGQADGGSAAMLVVDLAGRAFARANIELALAPITGSIKGVVRNRNGSLVPGATIVVLGTDASVQADQFGRFSLDSVTVGSRILEARAVGYMMGRAQTNVRQGGGQQVDIVVGDSVAVLEPVIVEGEYEPYLKHVGFTQRSHTAQGHFLDTTAIAQSGALRFEELFRMVPGVQLRPNGTGMLVELQRGQGEINNRELGNYCPPMYFIDGVYYPLPPLQTQSVPVVPSEILGIEVYSNLFSAPPQFQRRGSGCGVVLIWTKRGTPRRRASQ